MDGIRIEKGTGGGTPRRRVMEAFKLRELSAVDRPAQQHAKMTLMKRAGDDTEKAFNPNQPRHPKGSREGGRWSVGGGGGSGGGGGGLSSLISRAKTVDTSDWSEDTEDELNQMLRRLEDYEGVSDDDLNEDDLDDRMHLIARVKNILDSTKSVSQILTEKGTDMTQEEMQKKLDAEAAKSAELKAKLDKAEADIAALKTAAAAMDEEEMAAAALMDEKSKKSFEAMSKADRKAHLAELRKNDEVLKVEGVGEIRKSLVGETQFAVFKAQQTRIEKAEAEAAKQAELAKRADLRKSIETGVLKNLPGEVDAVVDAMKAIGDLDPTIGKTINTMLEAGAKAIGAAYTSLGHAGEAKKAAGDFLKKVDEIKTAEKCSHQDAMVKARKDHPELFKAYQEGGAKGN